MEKKWLTFIKGGIAGGIVMAVIQIGPKYPSVGGLILTLPSRLRGLYASSYVVVQSQLTVLLIAAGAIVANFVYNRGIIIALTASAVV